MRQLIAYEEVSLDGVVHNPHEWPNHRTPDFNADMAPGFQGDGVLLFGRRTYEMMAAYWPEQDHPVGHFMNRARKYVVSSTLEELSWQNSTVIAGDPLEAIRALKASPGPDVVMLGSLTLLESLLEAELVDAFQLMVHPVLVGTGRKFPESALLNAFTYRRHTAYAGGVVRVICSRASTSSGPAAGDSPRMEL